MQGVELDFCVKDCRKALKMYKSIFDVEVVEETELESGQNEAVFTIYGTRFHMLDENPSAMLGAPSEGDPKPFWFNVMVDDIQATWDKAIGQGVTAVQEITRMDAYGVSNAMFSDPFGYIWMLHEIHAIVSFDDRVEMAKSSRDGQPG
jgi:uncharacterized glyoxalase superfamily protein PhnB